MTTLEDIKPGNVYADADGRVLTVLEVRPGDPLGREIVGRVRAQGAPTNWRGHDYATDQQIFQAVWLEKRPRVNVDTGRNSR